MRYSISRSMSLYLLITAGMAMFFALVLQVIWLCIPNAPATIVKPGLALPEAVLLQVNSYSDSDNGITIEPIDTPRFLCARLHFQRDVFTILDNAPIRLRQERKSVFPFGISQDYTSILRPQRELDFPQGEGRELPLLLYIRSATGFGTGGLMIWMEGAHRLFTNPTLTFTILFPLLLIFSGSCLITRILLDSEQFLLRSLISIVLLFFAYIMIAIFGLTVGSPGDWANANAEVIRELVYFGFCAVGIRAWRKPAIQFIPRVGIFVTCCIDWVLFLMWFLLC